ncbi:PTS sugar transporter subunit IIC [Erwinia sp. CPCC 100877]|nr:PTS sugar transporter subunit IIC [Erwinia sp. CPCC 100877]
MNFNVPEGFMNGMTSIANKIGTNKYLLAIREAFVTNMPLIITGSFATLFANVISSPTNGLAQFEAFSFLAGTAPLFSAISYATVNMLAFFICYLVGASLGEANKQNSRFTGLLALASYIIAVPTELSIELDGVNQLIPNIISNTTTNAQGLFLAMLIALMSVAIFSKLMSLKRLKIKMPDSVPAGIADSFSSLIPTILTLFIISLISFTFRSIFNMYLSDAIFNMLQAPLQSVMQNPLGILVIIFVTQVFWLFGLHGANITSAIREPLMYTALAANMESVANGNAPEMIVSKPFWSMYCTIGGSGCTLGLLIAIFMISKREDYRTIAKLSSVPAIFTINEPLIFGLPIVLNPIMAIPFVLTPLVTAALGYFATFIGFAGAAYVEVPWTTPVFINAYLSTGGSIGAVVTQAIGLVLSVLIYLPFVKIAGSQKLQEEV